MTRITRRVLALPVVVALAAVGIISLSVSPASADVVAGDHHSYSNHFGSNHHAGDDKSASTATEVDSLTPAAAHVEKSAAAQVERECPTKHRSSPPPAYPPPPVKTRAPVTTPTPVESPTVTPSTPHAAEGGGNPLTSLHTAPTRPIITSHSRPTHIVTKPAKTTPTPVAISAVVATAAIGAAPAETAVTPTLITASESESLALGDSPSTSPASATSSTAAGGLSATPSSSAPGSSQTINLASGSRALGLSDNLMLAALVAVFALAVIALVTAGGRRSGWRQH
jgi:hypothetical protein